MKVRPEGPDNEDEATQCSSSSWEEGYSPVDSDAAHGSLYHQVSGDHQSWEGTESQAAALTWDWEASSFTSGELRPMLPLQLLLGTRLAEKDETKPGQNLS